LIDCSDWLHWLIDDWLIHCNDWFNAVIDWLIAVIDWLMIDDAFTTFLSMTSGQSSMLIFLLQQYHGLVWLL